MVRQDLPLAMRLKEQAGWNQTEADWLRHLDLEPNGCFVAEVEGTPCGTVCTCVFGPVAWIAMLLVDAPLRRRGVGAALVGRAMEYLDGRGIRSVRLDATALGRPLYEKLGFEAQFELARFEGVPAPSSPIAGAMPPQPEEIDQILRLDRTITATDRSRLLARLFAEQPEGLRVARDSGRVAGYASARPGTSASQIGPCLGEAAAAELLLADGLARYAGRRVYVDIPLINAPAVALASRRGLAEQRRLVRMCRGDLVQEDLVRFWASFGPEKG